jgi:hypothetical protein
MAPKIIVFVLTMILTAVTTATASKAGGTYIQRDPRNPSSPIRCTADGW